MLPPQLVAAAIREKLQVEDDNDQDILGKLLSVIFGVVSVIRFLES